MFTSSTNPWPTAAEYQQLERAIEGLDLSSIEIKMIAHSPWLAVDVWVHLVGERKFALWRSTGAVYLVGLDGAVGDDPIVPPAWKL